jgi:LPXTG-motif cell wall-anchored protein
MNQSLTQTITVTTAPVPGVPNTGFLANTGENLPLFAAIGGILLMLSAIIFVV